MRFSLFFCLLFFVSTMSLAGPLLVGVSEVELEMDVGIPLAGYGNKKRRLKNFFDWGNKIEHSTLFRPSVGELDPLRVKVFVLEKENKSVMFVNLDVIGVTFRFHRDLWRRFRHKNFSKEEIFVSATHTHSGPGTLTRRLPLAVVAVDFFVRENYEHVLSKTTQAIELALKDLSPAVVYKGVLHTQGLQRNKWRNKGEGHFDADAGVISFVDQQTDQIKGVMINYALHGNSLGPDNLHFSADNIGALEREMEKGLAKQQTSEPVVAIFNGAQGDVDLKERGEDNLAPQAQKFRRQLLSQWSSLGPYEIPWIKTERKMQFLGVPAYPLALCADDSKWVNRLIRNVRLPLPIVMAAKTWLYGIRMGELSFLSWPGEPSHSLGLELKRKVKRHLPNVWILGLTNDYMAYFNTKEEYKKGQYDSCSNLYTWRGGRRIIRGLKKIARRLAR